MISRWIKSLNSEVLSEEIKNRIEERIGKKIHHAEQCENLSKAIYRTTDYLLEPHLLAELWGFQQPKERVRADVLDGIAMFIGYPDWAAVPEELKGDHKHADVYEEQYEVWRWRYIHKLMWSKWGFLVVLGLALYAYYLYNHG